MANELGFSILVIELCECFDTILQIRGINNTLYESRLRVDNIYIT